jgi:hypothetical protein
MHELLLSILQQNNITIQREKQITNGKLRSSFLNRKTHEKFFLFWTKIFGNLKGFGILEKLQYSTYFETHL